MTHVEQKTTNMPKSKKKKSEEIRQTSVADSDMTQILELSEKQFKITMNCMLSAPIENISPYSGRDD